METQTKLTLDDAIELYASLERSIAEHIPSEFKDCCIVCGAEGRGCCRQDVGQSAIDTWWFRLVSLHSHGKWWDDNYLDIDACPAMTKKGCSLVSGRPSICSSFFCEKMMMASTNPWRLVLFTFLSDLPGWSLQVGSRKNFALLESSEEARPLVSRFIDRIGESMSLLNTAVLLCDDSISDNEKHKVTLRLICENPRFLRPMVRRRLVELMDKEKFL